MKERNSIRKSLWPTSLDFVNSHDIHAAFSPTQAEQHKGLLHKSPREFGQSTSMWTLEVAIVDAYGQTDAADEKTQEAVADWQYWVARGYKFRSISFLRYPGRN